MRLLIANPNATRTITESCVALARAVSAPGTEVEGWTNAGGPPVIDSDATDAVAAAALVPGLAALAARPDAIVLAGFGDYGTAAVKAAMPVPVVAMAEAAMSLAAILAQRFAIVTTAARMIAYTERLVADIGFASRCTAVRAIELPPVTAPDPAEADVVAALVREAERAPAGAIVLGGSRLAVYAAAMRRATTAPIVEPLACAVGVAETLVRSGLAPPTGCAAAPARGAAPSNARMSRRSP
jgi:allantoin racemase